MLTNVRGELFALSCKDMEMKTNQHHALFLWSAFQALSLLVCFVCVCVWYVCYQLVVLVEEGSRVKCGFG